MHMVMLKSGTEAQTNQRDGIAVLGVFFELSNQKNDAIQQLISGVDKVKDGM